MSLKSGSGRRVAMAEKEVRQVVSAFVLNRYQEEAGGFINISRVKMTPDLKQAHIYISLLSTEGGVLPLPQRQTAAKTLQYYSVDVQDQIAAELRPRFVPKVFFHADEALDTVLKIEGILHQISRQKTQQDSD